jgi:septation ring formation regulator EzrA
MSGECDDCGEHCLDCKCEEMHQKDQIEILEDAVYSIQRKLSDPNFDKYNTALGQIDSKINLLFEKLEDNARRLNSMMLEMKGIIAMSRGGISKNMNKEV